MYYNSLCLFNSLPTRGNFCCLLITFQDQAWRNFGPDLDPKCLTPWGYSWKIFFGKVDFDIKSTDNKSTMKNYPSCRVKETTELKMPFAADIWWSYQIPLKFTWWGLNFLQDPFCEWVTDAVVCVRRGRMNGTKAVTNANNCPAACHG